jgi:hypothetical protein
LHNEIIEDECMRWIIILWTVGAAALLWWLAGGKRWQLAARIAAVCLGAVAVSAAGPIAGPLQPPTQIVYRFDDHRRLELTGWGCEGAIHYIDTKRKIRGEVASQFARVFLPSMTHADDDGDFIFFPLDDLSGFIISKDHGKTFESATWIGSRPSIEVIKKVTVIHRQAFLEGKDGRLFMTSKPIGERWGRHVVDAVNVLPNVTDSDLLEFQGLPKTIPPVKNYQGWTEMHCDPGRAGVSVPEDVTFAEWQWNVLAALGHTVALPVTLIMNTAFAQ